MICRNWIPFTGLGAYPLNYWLVTCRDVSSTP